MAYIGEMEYLSIGGNTYSIPGVGNVGEIVERSISSTVNVSASTVTTALSCTGSNNIPEGCYTGNIEVAFAKEATGYIRVYCGTSSSSPTNPIYQGPAVSSSNYGTRLKLPILLSLANDSTYYVFVYSSVACTVSVCKLELMRVR